MLFRRPVSDRALVERVLRGQRYEFARLVDRYLPMVHALAFAHVGNATDAEDVAQETFLKAFTSLNTLHNRAAFRPWLAAIARNAAVTMLRARKPKSAVDPNLPSNDSPDRDLERRELHEVLRREILRLDPEFREVLLLHYFSGLKIREVAGAIGASPGATAKRIQRARDALGKSLVRELGLLAGDEQRDWRKARTKIMAALAATPVVWEAKALAGVGGATLAPKLIAALASLALIGGAGFFLASMSGQAEPAAQPSVAGAEAEDEAPTALPDVPEEAESKPVASAAVRDSSTIPHDGPGIVRGRVIYPDGRAAPHAKVVLIKKDSSLPPVAGAEPQKRETTAEADGRFTFGELPIAGTVEQYMWYFALAYIEGEAAASAGTVIERRIPGRFLWLELQPAGQIAGRVVDSAGQPVEDALVTPWKWSGADGGWSPVKLEQRTDGTGAFSCPYLYPGEWRFVVSAAGYARTLSDEIALGTADALITLQRGCTVRGTAVDTATGAPAPAISLRLIGSDLNLDQYETLTTEDGTWVMADLPPGEYSLTAGGPYYLPSDESRIVVSDHGSQLELNLALRLGGAIEGRVYWKGSGASVTDAPVECKGSEDRTRHVRTGNDGVFRIEGLPPGHCELMLDLLDNPRRTLSVEEAGAYTADFAIEEGKEVLAGVVVNPEGNPVPGAVLTMDRQGKTTTSGADGSFVFTNLGHSQYSQSLEIYKTGSAASSMCVDSGYRDDLRMMVGEPAWISGRVVDERGAAVAGVRVNYRLISGSLCIWHPAQTTDGGRFALSYLLPGEYALSVERTGMPQVELQTVQVAPGEMLENVVLTLSGPQATAALAGTVVDTADNPVAGAWIRAQGPRQASADARTDERGAYRIEGLGTGLFQVSAFKNEYAESKLVVTVPTAAPVDIVLQRSGRISGRAYDARTSSPLRDFRVAFIPGEDVEVSRYESGARHMTSDLGEFALVDLAPSAGTLAVWADGYDPAWTTLVLPEGEHIEGQELALTPSPAVANEPETQVATVSLGGSVIDPQGRPVAGANVYIEDIPHPSNRLTARAAVTDEKGRYAVAGVPVPTTRLFAMHKDFAPGASNVTLRANAEGHANIALAPNGTVTGTVEMDGAPVSGAWISVEYYLLDERIYENGNTDGQGGFTIRNIPAGEANAQLHLDIGGNRHRTYERAITVPAGGTADVVFSLVGGTAVVEGTVMEGGEPVSATITISIPLEGGAEDLSTMNSSDDGTFIIPMLPQTPLTLHVRHEDREHTVEVTPTDLAPIDVEIELAE